jgi:NAD(P)-dependent dehydrogenase (short-subunit alcohol dehydrogenase family)
MAKILITGAAGGFGALTITRLLERGHRVVGTVRDLAGRNRPKADELVRAGATVIEMDVTSDASVERAVAAASVSLGGLEVVINNAGVGVLGLTEAFTAEDVKRVFDVNVIGVHRVLRAAVPAMREAGSGLIINVSSLLGRITVPFYGPYNASKWALEGLSENYRVELSQSGIEVCLVEPGGYPTSFVDNLVRPSDAGRSRGYGALDGMPETFMRNFEQAMAANPAQDPSNVAVAIAELVDTPTGNRPFRTIVDAMGMGGPIDNYNTQLERITADLYGKFGIANLLSIPLHSPTSR